MKKRLRKLSNWIAALLWRHAVAIWPGAKDNWRHGLGLPGSWFYIVWAALWTIVIVPTGFEMGLVSGLSFLGATLSVWYFGYIFRDELAMVYVYTGFLTNGTMQTGFTEFFSFSLNGGYLPSIALVFVFACLWGWSERMKRSDFDLRPLWTTRFREVFAKLRSQKSQSRS